MKSGHLSWALVVTLATSGLAAAAPNVTNVTQKGSLLVFPHVMISGDFNSLMRIENDGSADVDVKCYWMDSNKNRVDFIIPVTKNQAVWFDARTGNGTYQVNPFPTSAANGFDNPFIQPTAVPGPGPVVPTSLGMLACWAVDGGAQNQIKWNHLSGTATVYAPNGAFEYDAYAFFVPTGLDLAPVGIAGTLNLNGVEYDSCPLYQVAQFTPRGTVPPPGAPVVGLNILTVVGCTLDLRQDWAPAFTKLQFDVWNEDEIKFTGAYECADSWHSVSLSDGSNAVLLGGGLTVSTIGIDAATQNFAPATLGTYAARYRVQGIKSSQCEKPATTGASDTYRPAITTQAVGIVGVHWSSVEFGPGNGKLAGTTLASAGKFTGKISWDPSGAVPEGGVR